MKKIHTIFLLYVVFLSSCSPKEVDSTELVNRNGMYYTINSNKPFSGKSLAMHENGQLKEQVFYSDGLITNEKTTFFENGMLESKELWEYGKKNGYFESYFISGNPNVIGQFKDNTPEGEWKEYEDSGQVKSIYQYIKDDVYEERFSYHENGALSSRSTYKNGLKHGAYEIFNDQNFLVVKGTYLDDKREGELIRYFDNGVLASNATYLNGKEVRSSSYSEEGKLKREFEFREDSSITKRYDHPNGGLSSISYYSEQGRDEKIFFDLNGKMTKREKEIYSLIGGAAEEVTIYNDEEKIDSVCDYKKSVRSFCYFYCPDGVTKKRSVSYQENGVLTAYSRNLNSC